MGPGAVELGAETLEIDWRVFAETFLSRVYATRLDDAIVVDCGAHKGYFGAYALLGGGAAVL